LRRRASSLQAVIVIVRSRPLPHPPILPPPPRRRRVVPAGCPPRRPRGDIKEEDGNPPSATLALQSPFSVEPRIVTFPRRCHHIEAPRAWSSVTSSPPPHHHRSVHSFPEAGRNGRSLAKAPSRSGKRIWTLLPTRPLSEPPS
ncbi:Os02g0518800, partial [Oryza sativa Japonica Group]